MSLFQRLYGATLSTTASAAPAPATTAAAAAGPGVAAHTPASSGWGGLFAAHTHVIPALPSLYGAFMGQLLPPAAHMVPTLPAASGTVGDNRDDADVDRRPPVLNQEDNHTATAAALLRYAFYVQPPTGCTLVVRVLRCFCPMTICLHRLFFSWETQAGMFALRDRDTYASIVGCATSGPSARSTTTAATPASKKRRGAASVSDDAIEPSSAEAPETVTEAEASTKAGKTHKTTRTSSAAAGRR